VKIEDDITARRFVLLLFGMGREKVTRMWRIVCMRCQKDLTRAEQLERCLYKGHGIKFLPEHSNKSVVFKEDVYLEIEEEPRL